MMKTVSLFLALINSLLAGLLLMYNLSSSQFHWPSALWLLAESLAALSVILIGILTWLACMITKGTGPLLIGSLFLVVLGAVTIVWMVHLAVINGHMQYPMAVFGASLMTQGITSLMGFGVESQIMANT
jgi:hypothetical protein